MTRRFFSGLFLTTSGALWAGSVATSTKEAIPSLSPFLPAPPQDLYLADDRFHKLIQYLRECFLSYKPVNLRGDLTCIVSRFDAEMTYDTIDVTSLASPVPNMVRGLGKTTIGLDLGHSTDGAPMVRLEILLLPGFSLTFAEKGTKPAKPYQTRVAKQHDKDLYLDNWQGYITSFDFLNL